MANKVKIQLNRQGVQEMMKSPEMMAICKDLADDALGRLGDGYVVTTYNGKTRVNASIMAETYQAKKENSENNTILKAIRGG